MRHREWSSDDPTRRWFMWDMNFWRSAVIEGHFSNIQDRNIATRIIITSKVRGAEEIDEGQRQREKLLAIGFFHKRSFSIWRNLKVTSLSVSTRAGFTVPQLSCSLTENSTRSGISVITFESKLKLWMAAGEVLKIAPPGPSEESHWEPQHQRLKNWKGNKISSSKVKKKRRTLIQRSVWNRVCVQSYGFISFCFFDFFSEKLISSLHTDATDALKIDSGKRQPKKT